MSLSFGCWYFGKSSKDLKKVLFVNKMCQTLRFSFSIPRQHKSHRQLKIQSVIPLFLRFLGKMIRNDAQTANATQKNNYCCQALLCCKAIFLCMGGLFCCFNQFNKCVNESQVYWKIPGTRWKLPRLNEKMKTDLILIKILNTRPMIFEYKFAFIETPQPCFFENVWHQFL